MVRLFSGLPCPWWIGGGYAIELAVGRSFRPHGDIRRPVHELGMTSADGVPYLAPEVQLYYKAKAPRPKDEEDFTTTLPLLTDDRRDWLAGAIPLTYGVNGPHPWLTRLRRADNR
ncbi:nucleotidyltransferase domain-containing protein [Streptomyces sp. NPDC057307]|uniref:nucleotidyltransferase domain-containing protein n=1 Tax=Streptomyces sp. NPDC057307 TaxID=3346096 RepID=UPI003645DB63